MLGTRTAHAQAPHFDALFVPIANAFSGLRFSQGGCDLVGPAGLKAFYRPMRAAGMASASGRRGERCRSPRSSGSAGRKGQVVDGWNAFDSAHLMGQIARDLPPSLSWRWRNKGPHVESIFCLLASGFYVRYLFARSSIEQRGSASAL
jgi:hypothetical protein